MSIQSVLIEYESPSNEIFASSGLLFSTKQVLITANPLVPYLKQLGIQEWLRLAPGVLHPVTDRPQVRIVLPGPRFKNGRVSAVFVSGNILRSTRKHLRDWRVDFEDASVLEALALFFLVEIDGGEALERFEMLLRGQERHLEIGEEVFMESTPFGSRMFLNSYSQGVLSNVAGEEGCFLLTDCPSSPGSEGAPVFLRKGRVPVGIVISCLNWWKGEWVGLTLVANLAPLLAEMVKSKGNSLTILPPVSKNLALMGNSIAQLIAASAWGTAILIDRNKGIFLTNSHVVESASKVALRWNGINMEASVLFKTPAADVYDLAILESKNDNRMKMTQVEITMKPALVGEEVYAAGFPLFAADLNPKPSITRGHVSQVSASMIKTTCTVLPGSSGGAIFRPSGQLLAVIVSNTKMDDGVTHPRVNMAIPLSAIYSTLDDFLKSGDCSTLEILHTKDRYIRQTWNTFTAKY